MLVATFGAAYYDGMTKESVFESGFERKEAIIAKDVVKTVSQQALNLSHRGFESFTEKVLMVIRINF